MSKKKKHKVLKLTDEEYAKYIASITNCKEPSLEDAEYINKQ